MMTKKIISTFLLSCLLVLGLQLTAKEKSAKQDTPALPKLIDFGAKQCMACKKLAPILEELKKEYADQFETQFIDVWVKENVAKAKEYKISKIPTQIFIGKDGKELFRHVGFISKEDILKKWKELGYQFKTIEKKTVKQK